MKRAILACLIFVMVLATVGWVTMGDVDFTGRVNLPDPTKGALLIGDTEITSSASEINYGTDRDLVYDTFEYQPLCVQEDGTACSGTNTEVNVLYGGQNHVWEEHIIGTQTLKVPDITSSGWEISLDDADNEGAEYTLGITAQSPCAFDVGTDAFYVKAKLYSTDVSGSDEFAVGFRGTEAYHAAIDDYNDMACLNKIAGDIKIETIDDAGATTTTDTTDNWADTSAKTLGVFVDKDGNVTYTIDGSAPSTTAAFAFDDDANGTVVPFIHVLNAANVDEAIYLQSFECGLQ
jgi:hypothetical protein